MTKMTKMSEEHSLGKERRIEYEKPSNIRLEPSHFIQSIRRLDRDGRRKVFLQEVSFTTAKLEKLNTHAKKILVVHNVGKAPDTSRSRISHERNMTKL